MRPYIALIRRELLEHRGAFLYAPAMLVAALFVVAFLGINFGEPSVPPEHRASLTGVRLYQLALGGIFFAWSVYLMIALFFYYADSFSADRRNNSLLFWKSMPQSDFKVLSSKALAGVTVFPALIFCFAMITGALVYLFGFIVAARLPFLPLIWPADMLSNWIQAGVAGAVFFILNILWFAPFLAWVAALSTLVQRWSIPLAFLIPGAVVLAERLTTIGHPDSARPIASYLRHRFRGFMEGVHPAELVFGSDGLSPLSLIGMMLARIDWLQMALGLVVAVLLVYLASEYRRRRIEA